MRLVINKSGLEHVQTLVRISLVTVSEIHFTHPWVCASLLVPRKIGRLVGGQILIAAPNGWTDDG